MDEAMAGYAPYMWNILTEVYLRWDACAPQGEVSGINLLFFLHYKNVRLGKINKWFTQKICTIIKVNKWNNQSEGVKWLRNYWINKR